MDTIRETDERSQAPPRIVTLCRAAELQGELWARHGRDVNQEIRRHAPHWPVEGRDRMRLIAAVLAGAEAVVLGLAPEEGGA